MNFLLPYFSFDPLITLKSQTVITATRNKEIYEENYSVDRE